MLLPQIKSDLPTHAHHYKYIWMYRPDMHSCDLVLSQRQSKVCCLLLFTNDQEISENHRQQSTNQNSWRRDREPVRLGKLAAPSLSTAAFLGWGDGGTWKEIGFTQRENDEGKKEGRKEGLDNPRRGLLVLNGSNKAKQHIHLSWWSCTTWTRVTASLAAPSKQGKNTGGNGGM